MGGFRLGRNKQRGPNTCGDGSAAEALVNPWGNDGEVEAPEFAVNTFFFSYSDLHRASSPDAQWMSR